MKDLTSEELKEYNGRDGKPAYVAYNGIIYNVTDSAMWGEGDHEGMHAAGEDLTDAHEDAPHDIYVTDFPEVGRLV